MNALFRTRRGFRSVLVAVGVVCAGVAARAQEVPVRIVTAQGAREIILVRRSGAELQYRMPDAPPGVTASFNPSVVERADFAFTLDLPAVHEAMRRRQWLPAAQRLMAAVQPALPYLDLPDNNVFDPALLAGRCLLRAAGAQAAAGEAGDAGAAETARQLYGRAHEVLRQVSAAGWNTEAEPAGILGILGLVEASRLDDAANALQRAREPDIGDRAYGMYWYATARLRHAQGQPAEALEAALRSMLYETKDIESFPGAMLQAAIGYEDINEFHRARDLYFETARLFRGTPWGIAAHRRLEGLMKQGRADADEPADIAGVFFGSVEDMNAVITAFLEASAAETTDDPPAAAEAPPAVQDPNPQE
jgi:tetratricopeptide (TPR) repeat protein